MRAAITPQYGTPNVIEVQDVPRPALKAGQVLVEVVATPVTAGDRRLRAADFPGFTAIFGRLLMGLTRPRHAVQGTMFAGRIVEVAADVTEYAVGDAVFGAVDHGAYAEYVVVAADGPMAKMPAQMDFAEAAEVPYGGVTALRFVRDLARVKPGEAVLIVGASGGVGRYAIQIARHLGARVTAVCSARNAALVRRLGAHAVIDYRTTDFTRGATRYDVIFDIADATRFGRCRRVLTPTGRYLSVYMSIGLLWRALTTRLFGTQRAYTGVAMGTRADLAELSALLERRAITPVVAERFDLDAIAAAHARADAGRSSGGVLVLVKS